VLGRQVGYFDCTHCGYLQTEKPYWLEEAYETVIADLDTGIMWRNLRNMAHVVLTLTVFGRLRGRVLDHAGGYGILVRLLRDVGVEAHWRDKYCQNLLAGGFESDPGPYDLITAFEVFEHLEHPLEELRAMLQVAPIALISTDLVPSEETPSPDWWYLGPDHGQHIGFFRTRTLAHLAREVGCSYRTDGRTLHVFSKRSVPALWLPLQRMRWLAKVIAKARLESKLGSDHEALRRRQAAASSPRPSGREDRP
jgi:hypothetical protein